MKLRLLTSLLLAGLLGLMGSGCMDYRVQIKTGDARLYIIPKHQGAYLKDKLPKYSYWEVLDYKHGFVKVKGPLAVKKMPETPQKTGWLRERDFSRSPIYSLAALTKLKSLPEDVPIRWLTVPMAIVCLALLLALRLAGLRHILMPAIVTLFILLGMYLAHDERRKNQLGSKVFRTVGEYLAEKNARVYTMDDIWRRRLNFYMGFKATKGRKNTILALSLNRYLASPGGYYVVVDPRLYYRITWTAPPFVQTGVFPGHWQQVLAMGQVRLFYVPAGGSAGS